MSRSCCRAGMTFQSTRPRGARQEPVPDDDEATPISIHAPTRGATENDILPSHNNHNFNPRAHEGRDSADIGNQSGTLRISIHAPTRGATGIRGRSWLTTTFQSTRPRGARRMRFMASCVRGRFQSTRPRGARRNF